MICDPRSRKVWIRVASRRQRDWSDAAAELTQILLEGEDEDAALALMTRRVSGLSRGTAALVGVGGAVISGLLAFVVWVLGTGRARAMALAA